MVQKTEQKDDVTAVKKSAKKTLRTNLLKLLRKMMDHMGNNLSQSSRGSNSLSTRELLQFDK